MRARESANWCRGATGLSRTRDAAGLSDNEKKALQLEAERGMEEKSAEFRERGGQIYLKEG